ncbi:MAG: hypothetical protein OSB00_15040 [Sphingomonas bacterium]|nr:hypothetical protein [Sphingomonas bacterium]
MDREALIVATGVIAVAALLVWYLVLRKIERAGWSIGPLVHGDNYSRNMPSVPTKLAGGVWSVLIEPGAELDGVTIARGPVTGSIFLRYRVTGDGLYPSEVPGEEPILTVYLQRKGDNWSGAGKYDGYRFYRIAPLPLTPGEHEAMVPLEAREFVGVSGAGAWDLGSLFTEALASNGRIGLAFGHRHGRMHGVETTEPVIVDLLEWRVG